MNKLTLPSTENAVQSKINEIIDDKSDYYGTCATGASTQIKVVVCPDFALKEGASVRVRFTNAQNYNGPPKLNVNGTGAISVVLKGTTGGVRYMWQSGDVVEFTYDGTYWVWGKGGTATTTYYGVTKLATSATSTGTGTTLTSASLNLYSQSMIAPYDVYSSSATYAVGDRVRYNFNAWECNTAIETAEAWTEEHWTALDPIQTQLDTKVSNTDYANSATGGVIKVSSTTGTGISGAGVLYSSNSSYATYQGASDYYFISKGTLEKVLTAKGYTDNIGTVTSVNNIQPDANGNVSLTIPDTSNLANIDLSNVPSSKGILTESYVNGTSWYRVYSDGWCEQGGTTSTGAWTQVFFLKPFINTNYTIIAGSTDGDRDGNTCSCSINSKAVDSFWIGNYFLGSAYSYSMWYACGYINQGDNNGN